MDVDLMARALKQKGATVLGSYHCKGRAFLLFNQGHPDQADLDGVREFAREMARLG